MVEEYIHKLITFPAIFAVQDATIEREFEGVDASRVYNSESAPRRPSPEDELKEPTMSTAGIRNFTLLIYPIPPHLLLITYPNLQPTKYF